MLDFLGSADQIYLQNTKPCILTNDFCCVYKNTATLLYEKLGSIQWTGILVLGKKEGVGVTHYSFLTNRS